MEVIVACLYPGGDGMLHVASVVKDSIGVGGDIIIIIIIIMRPPNAT
jgi:hypothetical protein